jgi:hypothetical protein
MSTTRATAAGDILYRKEQCPGVDPPHPDPFPVINTLLSIPFSLLHNLPRLSGLVNSSDYRSDLLTMSVEIATLWAWDPDALPPIRQLLQLISAIKCHGQFMMIPDEIQRSQTCARVASLQSHSVLAPLQTLHSIVVYRKLILEHM